MYVNCDNMDLVYLFTNQILSDIHINIQQGTVYLLILWNKKNPQISNNTIFFDRLNLCEFT